MSDQNADYALPGILPPKERCEHAVVGICGGCWAEKRQNCSESATESADGATHIDSSGAAS